MKTLDCFAIKTGKNLAGTRISVQQRKCSLTSLECAQLISEFLHKRRYGFMLRKCKLVRKFSKLS